MSHTAEIPMVPGSESPLELKPLKAVDPKTVYHRRAQRLLSLAKDSPLADYFELCRRVVAIQARLAAEADFGQLLAWGKDEAIPLSHLGSEADSYWQGLLQQLLSDLLPQVDEDMARVLRLLMQQSPEQLTSWGSALRQGHMSVVPARFSLFIWAAMGVYWSHWAPMVIKRIDQRKVVQQNLCPICGCHPVASLIVDQPRAGLRYLHCSLCESEWHYIRAHCTSCGQDKGTTLWSFDDAKAQVRIESCDECHGYTKMLFVEKSPLMDVAADDLATLMLDSELNAKGFGATTVNPLLLAHETEQ
ncbi:formate dehydrogenase accessory protein FdhE [Shewanella xiamenensis]|uniref:formate dehydrogenase accessory protein FdhE n=1 Tax=Shewanella xiamenensis TaxID=332186 RepID=UPI0024A77B00|nr:formate dehydrogenase accessory protein FdhE [Shewanella xiamenensis]MDI5876976.1 formate dehydrogenase accessory protein FdhE [Shewanella xiamenensis]